MGLEPIHPKAADFEEDWY